MSAVYRVDKFVVPHNARAEILVQCPSNPLRPTTTAKASSMMRSCSSSLALGRFSAVWGSPSPD